MLSQYTWGQFILFVLVLVVLYYLGVGWLYYRDELRALLTPGKKGAASQLAGAAISSAPPLVRPTSAFGKPTPNPTDSEQEEGEEPAPEGAAQNLPTTTEAVVTGELPDSTAAATGLDDSAAESGPMDSAAALAADSEEQLDEDRTEEEDQADEQLANLVRQAAHQMPAEEEGATVAYEPSPTTVIEPLATFEELIASPQDIVPVLDTPLCEAGSLAEYIAQIMGGAEEHTAVPAALAGTDLEAQLLARTNEHAHELTLLFGDD